MSYEKHEWVNSETITAAKMNNIEDGIEEAAQSGGGGDPYAMYDAVIRLTHNEGSGNDSTANLTPSIVKGTYAAINEKISSDGVPHFLVEYYHPWGILSDCFGAYVVGGEEGAIFINVVGYAPVDGQFKVIGSLNWSVNDGLAWD